MKNSFLISVLLVLFSISAYAQSYFYTSNLVLGVTSVAANTTNTTAGTACIFPKSNLPHVSRIYLTASGVAATTNGSLIAFITTTQSDPGTNNFDTATQSNIKLTLTAIGASTNQVSDWFQLSGVTGIRVDRIENTFYGAVSNIAVSISVNSDR